ncbi:MAG: hypothetical protein G01um101472_46 [Parcubacteria group bacterium Gr01-1014_72]|jgi:hypothetical protein|nr:MAG: hypothetical protein G01um101472_46 [Parcubacteria group bacterium Gr01-1014_72]
MRPLSLGLIRPINASVPLVDNSPLTRDNIPLMRVERLKYWPVPRLPELRFNDFDLDLAIRGLIHKKTLVPQHPPLDLPSFLSSLDACFPKKKKEKKKTLIFPWEDPILRRMQREL